MSKKLIPFLSFLITQYIKCIALAEAQQQNKNSQNDKICIQKHSYVQIYNYTAAVKLYVGELVNVCVYVYVFIDIHFLFSYINSNVGYPIQDGFKLHNVKFMFPNNVRQQSISNFIFDDLDRKVFEFIQMTFRIFCSWSRYIICIEKIYFQNFENVLI